VKEASFYKQLESNAVECNLCAHNCKLSPGQTGICGVRQNVDGKLMSLVYGQAVAVHVDPIEKKPLFHVAPGSRSFSMATVGCNFKCKFCQNSSISQANGPQALERSCEYVEPIRMIEVASEQGCRSVAYTYTEPTIYFEYASECATLAKDVGIYNIFVSNGFMNPEPLKAISPVLDAANIDLKSFRDEFYRKFIGARLTPVLDTLKLMKSLGIWVEVTTLIIPEHNDSPEELLDIAEFISTELGTETPWHISRFYPQYKMTNVPPTPQATLDRAHQIGLDAGLKYVYTGNVHGHPSESTCCPGCGEIVIKRLGFQLVESHIEKGTCTYCQTMIDGIAMDGAE